MPTNQLPKDPLEPHSEEMTCGLPIELLCLATLSSYSCGHIEYTSSDKHFWHRFQGVANVLVDPKRASGNLQLHCKSSKPSSFS